MKMKEFEQYINTDEIYLFNIGEAQQAYATFGCHLVGELGMHRFLVWAPNARHVSVVGGFNGWMFQKTRWNGLIQAYLSRLCRVLRTATVINIKSTATTPKLYSRQTRSPFMPRFAQRQPQRSGVLVVIIGAMRNFCDAARNKTP